MTYSTVVAALCEQFPAWKEECLELMDEGNPLPYVALGCVLIPHLESALESANLREILSICAYLEEAARSSRADGMIENLLAIEIGEWLASTKYEDGIEPWLGPETRRVCGYVPGRATQRQVIAQEARSRTFWTRLKSIMRRFRR